MISRKTMASWATTTDDVKKIDMAFLLKAGYLCGWTRRSIGWTQGGESSGSVTAEVSVVEYEKEHYMELDYKVRRNPKEEWQPIKYRVSLTRTSCRYGGFRWWFVCPNIQCNRRIRILYEKGDLFVCRKCARLSYESQRYIRPDLRVFINLFRAEDMERNLKRWRYRGRPTRRYRRVLRYEAGIDQGTARDMLDSSLAGR